MQLLIIKKNLAVWEGRRPNRSPLGFVTGTEANTFATEPWLAMCASTLHSYAQLVPLQEVLAQGDYDEKADLWSLGVVLYELTTLQLPYDAHSLAELQDLIESASYPPLPPSRSLDLCGLITMLLQEKVW